MLFEINTLAFISGLVFLAQFIALYIQYIVNKTYQGVIWWLLGSTFMALGAIFSPLLYVKPFEFLARFANPLIVLGQIFLYVGIVRFLGKKENKRLLIFGYVVFFLAYNYFIYFFNDISSRTLAITVLLSSVSFMTAAELFFNKDRHISGSATFTAIVFLAYGLFSLIRIFFVLFSPPIKAYTDQGVVLELTFIIPIFVSLLWTFGFIIMMNQRLNAENKEEKEKLQIIFNASPDGAVISRLSDGTIVDINSGFENMTGFSRAEVIGNKVFEINLWHSFADREVYFKDVKEKGKCENRELVFERKNGSQFTGSISAKIFDLLTIPHIISIVHDITERKQAEQKIQDLIQQLEVEKKAALLNANTDSLTGLPNRRFFDEALNKEIRRAKRTGAPLSLIMLDVDHFKKFNDSYGHVAGDECLRQIGTTLKSLVGRATDIVARYGGEEFVAILTNTDQNGALTLAERIRKAVEGLEIPHASSKISDYVTVSLGVVTVNAPMVMTPEQIVGLADEAMYSAKRAGRNQVSVAPDNADLENKG
jgi:diguanylate cyclase (GGDEF)-like protein/PAS domain S-box-containing protein